MSVWGPNYKSIPRIKYESAEQLIEEFKQCVARTEPVILEGSNIMDVEKWKDLHYLSSLLGDRPVLVKRSKSCHFRYFDEKYNTGKFPFAASGRAMSLMETEGFVKILADETTDEVLGVHMVGPEVTELVAEAALAIEMGATAEDIARTIHAHPTLPEAVMEAAEAVHTMAVHIFQKK